MTDTAHRRLERLVLHALDERLARDPLFVLRLADPGVLVHFCDALLEDYPRAQAIVDALTQLPDARRPDQRGLAGSVGPTHDNQRAI